MYPTFPDNLSLLHFIAFLLPTNIFHIEYADLKYIWIISWGIANIFRRFGTSIFWNFKGEKFRFTWPSIIGDLNFRKDVYSILYQSYFLKSVGDVMDSNTRNPFWNCLKTWVTNTENWAWKKDSSIYTF